MKFCNMYLLYQQDKCNCRYCYTFVYIPPSLKCKCRCQKWHYTNVADIKHVQAKVSNEKCIMRVLSVFPNDEISRYFAMLRKHISNRKCFVGLFGIVCTFIYMDMMRFLTIMYIYNIEDANYFLNVRLNMYF